MRAAACSCCTMLSISSQLQTLADIKACSILNQSLPLAMENKPSPNEPEGYMWLFFLFKILLAADYTSYSSYHISSCRARMQLTISCVEHTHTQPEFLQNITMYLLIYILTSYSPACHIWSPCLLKESTLGTGCTCFIYKNIRESFSPTKNRNVSEYIRNLSFC